MTRLGIGLLEIDPKTHDIKERYESILAKSTHQISELHPLDYAKEQTLVKQIKDIATCVT